MTDPYDLLAEAKAALARGKNLPLVEPRHVIALVEETLERAAVVADIKALERWEERRTFEKACVGRTAAFAEATAFEEVAKALRALQQERKET